MDLAGVHGSVVVDSLSIVAPIVCGMVVFQPCVFVQYLQTSPWGRGGGCFTLIVFMMQYSCKCYVSFPHSPMRCGLGMTEYIGNLISS